MMPNSPPHNTWPYFQKFEANSGERFLKVICNECWHLTFKREQALDAKEIQAENCVEAHSDVR